MLNIIETDKKIHMEHSKEIGQVLMNTISFTVALQTKDFSSFSPEVLEQMEHDPDWLPTITELLQVKICESLLKSDHYDSTDDMLTEFGGLLNLYEASKTKPLTSNDKELFQATFDKFLALLLTDADLLKELLGLIQ